MDPNPNNFPILSYVLSKLPSMKNPMSAATVESDIENPQSPAPSREPHFDLSAQMPHLKNPTLINQMRHAAAEVARTRSALQALGPRPDHETLDFARLKLSELSGDPLSEDYRLYKSLTSLDEMHAAYEGMLSDAEGRLQRIYEAAVSGDESLIEGGNENEGDVEVNEDVVGILKDVEMGKSVERVDLIGKGLVILPEAFGRAKTVVVLNLSENKLKEIPDSISGLENLEELNLSSNMLESLPDSIGLLFKLKILDVSRNKITALPDSICHCRLLVELDASFNKLTYLPTNMGFELVNLKKLSIHLNKIRSLPTSIGEMKSLQLLDAHFNELHGLPHSIGKLTNLEILNISSNFSDMTELPNTISDLINLKELDLSNNQIHTLPATFGHLVNLTKLNVDQNPLVIPPQEVVNEGVEAVKAYMGKRWADMVAEEQRKVDEINQHGQGGLLTRSTSWLSSVVSNVSGTVSGYLGGGSTGKSNDDQFLNQQL